MAEQEWRLEIWSGGEYVPNPVLVAVRDPENYLEEGAAEPMADLGKMTAIMDYIKNQFPGGWRVEGGKLVSYSSPPKKARLSPPTTTWKPTEPEAPTLGLSSDDEIPF